MMMLVALVVLAVAALATSASAWTQRDVNFTDGDFTSGRVYNYGPQYDKTALINNSNWAGMYISNTYWGYLSVPLDQFDDDIHIHSAVVNFYAYGVTDPSDQIQLKLMAIDPRYAAAETLWVHMDDSYDLGLHRIQYDFYQYYRADLTGRALDIVRGHVAEGHKYLTIGFQYYNANAYVYQRYRGLYSFVRFQYDDSPPEVPVPAALDRFSSGETLSFSWSTSSDLPAGGNVSGVEYQAGLFLNASDPGSPWSTTSWSTATSWELYDVTDGATYTLGVRARDGSGFTSTWSLPVNTTVDNSPPSIPEMFPEHLYTAGLKNLIWWMPSTDDGIGNVSYEYQWTETGSFKDAPSGTTNRTDALVQLLYEYKYYYRVRSRDHFGHTSDWSNIVYSTQDASPPTVPVMMDEPEFTPGLDNTISWHSSYDKGIGVNYYLLQVATTPDFEALVGHVYTANVTTVTIPALSAGGAYYYRVMALDYLRHGSNWSSPVASTQDASGPSAPRLSPVPEYHRGGVELRWRPSYDEGAGMGWYSVEWSTDPDFLEGVECIDRVLGESVKIGTSEEGKWHIRVTPFDALGNPGVPAVVETTSDTTRPSVPVLNPLPEVHGDDALRVDWIPAKDETSGTGHRLYWQEHSFQGLLHSTEVLYRPYCITGLTDGVVYLISIKAFDSAGNSRESETYRVRIDLTPPSSCQLVDVPRFTSSTEVSLLWTGGTDEGGGPLEYRVNWTCTTGVGDTPGDAPPGGDSGWLTGTTYNVTGLEDGRTYTFRVVARDAAGHLSVRSNEVTTTVDLSPPGISIMSPADMATLRGNVQVLGLCSEANPVHFSVDVWDPDEEAWGPLYPALTETYPSGFVFWWDTSSLPDGSYILRVNLTDEVGLKGTAQVNVTLANALLSIGPLDLSFSDPRPVEGEVVTVYVEVRNAGDADAMNVTVEVYREGELQHSVEGLRIPARSSYLVYYETEARAGVYTAMAHSDLYDPDHRGATLETEDVGIMEGGGWSLALALALLAMVLALFSLVIALMGPRRSTRDVSTGTVRDE